MNRKLAIAAAALVVLFAAAPAHAVILPASRNAPINALTIKLEASGTHKLAYGSGGLNRTGSGAAGVKWTVTPGTGAPLAWPVAPANRAQFTRSIAGGLTGGGSFYEKGTATLTPPDPPADPFSCSGLTQPIAGNLTLTREVIDGLYRVYIPSFTALSNNGGNSCSPSSASPLYFGNNLDAASQAEFSLGQATLKQSVIRIPVQNGRANLPCGGSASSIQPCKQDFGWNGTVTLEKVCRNGAATAAGASGGGDPGISCASPCKGDGCGTPVLGVTGKEIIRVRDGNNVKVETKCLGGGRCRGRGKVFEVKAGGSRVARRRRPVLATGTFRVRGGTRKTVKLRLTRAGRRRFRRGRTRNVSIGFRLDGKRVGERRTGLRTRVRRR